MNKIVQIEFCNFGKTMSYWYTKLSFFCYPVMIKDEYYIDGCKPLLYVRILLSFHIENTPFVTYFIPRSSSHPTAFIDFFSVIFYELQSMIGYHRRNIQRLNYMSSFQFFPWLKFWRSFKVVGIAIIVKRYC